MNKVMTNRLLRQHWIVVFAAVCVFASAWPSPIGVAQPSSLPHLRRQGAATQLIVDGKPFLVLGGELGNSSSSSLEYMRPVWPKLVALNLNTVLVPVYWELIEPVEGKFDFTLVDSLIQEARKHGLRLAPLWFASWKNSMSCYAPAWVKTNQQLFIPEAILGPLSAVNALYAIGQHDAIGCSPFSIESVAEPARSLLAGSYDVLTQLAPLILDHQGKNEMAGFLPEGPEQRAPQQARLGGYTLNVTYERPSSPATQGAQTSDAVSGGLAIAVGPDEFIFAGTGLVVTFEANAPGPPLVGILSAQEGKYVEDQWQPGRWLNGDQTHQGRHLRLPPGKFDIQRVKLYRYR